jgi:hypothetical protein
MSYYPTFTLPIRPLYSVVHTASTPGTRLSTMSPQGVTLDAIARNKLSHGKPLKQKLAKGAK